MTAHTSSAAGSDVERPDRPLSLSDRLARLEVEVRLLRETLVDFVRQCREDTKQGISEKKDTEVRLRAVENDLSSLRERVSIGAGILLGIQILVAALAAWLGSR